MDREIYVYEAFTPDGEFLSAGYSGGVPMEAAVVGITEDLARLHEIRKEDVLINIGQARFMRAALWFHEEETCPAPGAAPAGGRPGAGGLS